MASLQQKQEVDLQALCEENDLIRAQLQNSNTNT